MPGPCCMPRAPGGVEAPACLECEGVYAHRDKRGAREPRQEAGQPGVPALQEEVASRTNVSPAKAAGACLQGICPSKTNCRTWGSALWQGGRQLAPRRSE